MNFPQIATVAYVMSKICESKELLQIQVEQLRMQRNMERLPVSQAVKQWVLNVGPILSNGETH